MRHSYGVLWKPGGVAMTGVESLESMAGLTCTLESSCVGVALHIVLHEWSAQKLLAACPKSVSRVSQSTLTSGFIVVVCV